MHMMMHMIMHMMMHLTAAADFFGDRFGSLRRRFRISGCLISLVGGCLRGGRGLLGAG
jgi:Na+/proline symporter